MEYPQQAKIRRMIELLNEELHKAYEQGKTELGVIYNRTGDAGIYPHNNAAPENNLAPRLGVSGGEAVGLFMYVCREGYVALSLGADLSRPSYPVAIDHITRAGLLEIGALPDPRQHLLAGLEAALRDIQQDPTLGQEEKEEKLSLGREAIEFARGLAVEVAAKVIVGGGGG